MPLRSSRFYLSGYPHYYGHLRLPPSAPLQQGRVGAPKFMHYLPAARNHILPRIPPAVRFVVYPGRITGFVNSESLAGIVA